MMTPSWVTREAARARTQELITEADAHRRGDEAGAPRRRAPWTVLMAAIRSRRATVPPVEAQAHITP